MRNTLGWPSSGTLRRSRAAAASTRAANGAWTCSLNTALLASKKSLVLRSSRSSRNANPSSGIPTNVVVTSCPFWCCGSRRALASRRWFQLVSWNIFAPVLPARKPGAGRLDHHRPQSGQLAACETDIDLLLKDALIRVPPSARTGSRSDVHQHGSDAGRCRDQLVLSIHDNHDEVSRPPMATVTQAYQFALDPTPRQRRALASHCGAARGCLQLGAAACRGSPAATPGRRGRRPALDPVSAAMGMEPAKQQVAPWWAENSKEAYKSGLDGLAR